MNLRALLITLLLTTGFACGGGTSESRGPDAAIAQENGQPPNRDATAMPRLKPSLNEELALIAENVDDFLYAEIRELVEDEVTIDEDLAERDLLRSSEHVSRYKRNFLRHLKAFENDVALLDVLLATAAPVESGLGWRVFLDGKKAWKDHNSTFTVEHLGDSATASLLLATTQEVDAEIEAAFDRLRAIQFSSIPL